MSFSDLPVEILCAVIEQAAHMFIADHRSWVMQLSFVSCSVAQLLRPILHNSVIVDSQNFKCFQSHDIRHIVLSLTRYLTIRPGVPHDDVMEILGAWKPAVGSFLSASWTDVRRYMLGHLEALSLRGISMRFIWLTRALVGRLAAPPEVLAQLTRVIAYSPSYWRIDKDDEVVDGRTWARAVTDRLPALLYLGLELLETTTEWISSDDIPDPHPQSDEYLSIMRDAFLALLEFNPHLSITVRVAGVYLERQPAIQEIIANSMPQGRIIFHYDQRQTDSWDDVEKIQEDDAWHLRDCFTDLSKIEFADVQSDGVSSEFEPEGDDESGFTPSLHDSP